MQNARSVLLALSLLSACAAADPGTGNADVATTAGVFGGYLAGRFAESQNDLDRAARDLLRAHDADPQNPELQQAAFLACTMDGRPEAVQLAALLPDNPAAELVLANAAANAGNWDVAEQRYHALPRQGLTQLLQPILVAWAQFGGGHADAALATLIPFTEGQRFRGVYALHAAMIADLSHKPADAARLYRVAQTEYGGLNLRLAQVIASWQMRNNHPTEAQQTLNALVDSNTNMAIAIPGLYRDLGQLPVSDARQGIAEAYLALAAALRQQDTNDYALLLLQLAIDMRPDFTAARLLMSDVLDTGKHVSNALRVLEPVAATDPLAPLIQLRRATLQDRMGNTEDAMRTLEAVAHDYPASPLPYEQEGDMLRMKKRYPDAVAAYTRALDRIPHPDASDWPVFYDRGVAYEQAKQWPQAEADLQHALQLSPDQPFVLNYLGYSWTEQNRNLPRARQMIEHAVQLRPNDGAIVDSLGWVLLRQGDNAEAVRQLEHAVELDPEDPTINGHLGDAYWAIGRKTEAQYQWRRALTLNPDADQVAGLETKLHEAEAPAATPATADRRTP